MLDLEDSSLDQNQDTRGAAEARYGEMPDLRDVDKGKAKDLASRTT